jgi:hypothetical protein
MHVTRHTSHVTLIRNTAFQLWQSSLNLASQAHPPPPAPPLLLKTSSLDDMIGPPSPYPDSVASISLGGASSETLVEDAAAAAEVLLACDMQPGLQPDACVVATNGGRVTAWAVDSWPAGGV